jgi:hypothetical protein
VIRVRKVSEKLAMAVIVAESWSSITISKTGLLLALRDFVDRQPGCQVMLIVDLPTPPFRLNKI